jgi:hypothetical protein
MDAYGYLKSERNARCGAISRHPGAAAALPFLSCGGPAARRETIVASTTGRQSLGGLRWRTGRHCPPLSALRDGVASLVVSGNASSGSAQKTAIGFKGDPVQWEVVGQFGTGHHLSSAGWAESRPILML